MITDRLQAVFGLVKPGVQVPVIIQVDQASLSRARELESYGAYTNYVARYVPHIVADVDEEAAKRIRSSGVATFQWYDEPTHPTDSPFHATLQDIQARVQARLAATKAGPGVVRAHLSGSVPFAVDVASTLVSLEDVRVATRSKDVFDGGLDGRGVTVAILDTGVDATHPMLEGQVAHSESFVPEAAGMDGQGHGTWCGACIAGKPTIYDGKLDQFRGQILQGMAPGARLWDGKVLASDGSGASSGILKGIEAALDAGVHIISMSLGSLFGAGGQAPDAQAVNAAAKKGVLVVVAAGNSYGWLTIGSPGSAVGAITVGSHSLRAPVPGVVSLFSSKGPTTAGVSKPNVGAPGGNLRPTEVILGATARGSVTAQESGDGSWALEAGTSMATPCVAGILAQLLPAGFPTERGLVEEALARGTRSRVPVKNNRLGWGPIDAVALRGAIGKPAGPVLAAYAGLLRGRGAPLAGAALGVVARAQRLPVDVNAVHLPLL